MMFLASTKDWVIVPQGDEENSAGVVGVNAAALRVNVPLNTASSRCTPSQARPMGLACHGFILPTIQSHLGLQILFPKRPTMCTLRISCKGSFFRLFNREFLVCCYGEQSPGH